MKTFLKFICSTITFAITNHSVADLLVEEPLSFGVFAVSNNVSVSSVSVSANGRASSTNSIHIIHAGNPARFTLVNYPPYTRLILSPLLPQESTVFVGDTERFTLIDLDMLDSVITDSLGEASLQVGGTIETSGNGQRYINTQFNLNLVFIINY